MTRISHNTAVLAKEKGYNEPHKHYSVHGNNFTGAINKGFLKVRNSDSSTMVTHPRQSELQKWLRDQHKIHLTVRCTITGKFCGEIERFDPKYYKETEYYKTYEDCLEEILFQSLGLIPAEIKQPLK